MSAQGKVVGILTCDYCGVQFECRHEKRLHAANHFCSRVCMGKYKKAHNPNYVACEVCGKLKKVEPNELKRYKHFTCSYKCMGELRKTIYLGEDNPNYGNTGMKNPISIEKRISNYGYVLLKMLDHPLAMDGGWIKEHRYVAEQFLMTDDQSVEINGKKYLSRKFDVHHIGGIRTNNDVGNLKILTRSEHMKLHGRGSKIPKNLDDDDDADGVRDGGLGSTGR